jgi:acyl-coenzyme A thioesterase PaaI-like protein
VPRSPIDGTDLHGQPLGGYVLAVALQPLRAQMPYPDLLVSSAFFLRPVTTGSVEIRTEVARVGRRTATGETRLFQGSDPFADQDRRACTEFRRAVGATPPPK